MHSEALHFQAFLSLHDISQTHKDSLNLNFEKLCEQEIFYGKVIRAPTTRFLWIANLSVFRTARKQSSNISCCVRADKYVQRNNENHG